MTYLKMNEDEIYEIVRKALKDHDQKQSTFLTMLFLIIVTSMTGLAVLMFNKCISTNIYTGLNSLFIALLFFIAWIEINM